MTATIAACLGQAGCDAAANAAAGAGAYVERTADKIGQKTDDASITLAVKSALYNADEPLARQVRVSTGNGVVSLVGTVPSAEAKARAEQIAAGQKGVIRVINGLDVGPGR